jgi:L-asparaginase II
MPAPSRPQTPSNPKPTKPFGTAAKAIDAVLTGKLSIEEAREAIKSASSIQEKLALISEVQTSIRAAIEACGNDMSAQAPLVKKLQAAQEAEAYAKLAESIQLGPRAARAKNLLEKYDL